MSRVNVNRILQAQESGVVQDPRDLAALPPLATVRGKLVGSGIGMVQVRCPICRKAHTFSRTGADETAEGSLRFAPCSGGGAFFVKLA